MDGGNAGGARQVLEVMKSTEPKTAGELATRLGMSAQVPSEKPTVLIYGRRWSTENAALSRTFDILVVIIMFIAVTAAFHLHFMLTVGDWDFWVDWKDRQYWVTVTPVLLITFPAALQYVFWEKFRLPIAATVAMLALTVGIWISRTLGFELWSYFPLSLVWPATMIAVIKGANSRSIDTPTRSATKMLAPYCRS